MGRHMSLCIVLATASVFYRPQHNLESPRGIGNEQTRAKRALPSKMNWMFLYCFLSFSFAIFIPISHILGCAHSPSHLFAQHMNTFDEFSIFFSHFPSVNFTASTHSHSIAVHLLLSFCSAIIILTSHRNDASFWSSW